MTSVVTLNAQERRKRYKAKKSTIEPSVIQLHNPDFDAFDVIQQ